MNTALEITYIVIIIVALCEALKRAGLPSRYAPLTAVIIGLVAVMPFGGVNFLSMGSGVVLGLATTGGYRLIKTSLLNK